MGWDRAAGPAESLKRPHERRLTGRRASFGAPVRAGETPCEPAPYRASMDARTRARIAETVEAECLAAGFATAPTHVAEALGMSVHRVHGAVATVMTHDPTGGFWSRVIGLGIDEPVTERVLDDVVDVYRRAGSTRVMLQMSPEASPDTWEELLTERGFTGGRSWVKLLRDTSPPPEPTSDLLLRELTRGDATAYAEVYWEAFGFPEPRFVEWMAASVGVPGWHHFGAYDGDRIVSVGALFVHGDTGGFYGAGTLPSHRARGGQGLMMAARTRKAAELGLTWLSTETGSETPEDPNPSLHNMRRYGFAELYERRNWFLDLS